MGFYKQRDVGLNSPSGYMARVDTNSGSNQSLRIDANRHRKTKSIFGGINTTQGGSGFVRDKSEGKGKGDGVANKKNLEFKFTEFGK